MRTRPYDVVIYGATGFTGGLVAEYFAQHVSFDRTPWAIAGRDRNKLLAVRARLSAIQPACAEIPIVVAAAEDGEALTQMVRQTRVVITTVGPFVRFGEPLFAACAEHGTDYVDSTGEPAFVDAMRSRYHSKAAASGAIMVSCCGVDSIPTDLGAYFTMRELAPSGAVALTGQFAFRGRASGGTWHSVLEGMRDARSALRAQQKPIEAKNGRRVSRKKPKLRRDPELGWLVPFPTIDPEIALRSAAVLPVYGPDFSYSHTLVLSSFASVAALGLGAAAVYGLSQLDTTRKWLGAMLTPGEGPSAEERAQSWFRLRFVASHAGDELVTEVSGGDPGYGETAKMLSEAGLSLAQDRDKLPGRSGVLTPAVAFGDVLIARLVRAGMVFRVVSG